MTASLIAVGALGLLALQGWIILHARAQQRRLGARLDALVQRLTARAEAAAQERARLLDALAGTAAPAFALAELGGGRVTLEALLAPARPLLLVFTDPRCGPCYELLPDVGVWQRVYGDRLTIALVSSGDPQTNLAMTAEYGVRPVLLQQETEVVAAYALGQFPAAVLVRPDGRVAAGPRYGTRAIRQLVADTLGLALPAPAPRAVQAVGVGEAAPPLRRPDLAGNVVDLAPRRGEPTLLVFWSPGCGHCQEVLPAIRAFERAPGRPRLVVVSHGPAALNLEAGFASPVVLDEDRTIAEAFGVGGTPAAVLIDGRGVVVSGVARGAGGVRAALEALTAPALPVAAAD
jgi:thiol-disulfide isomerase/thioredoxin